MKGLLMETKREEDQATKILMAFDACSDCMDGLLYLPAEKVGVIVHAALSMRREISKLEDELTRLRQQIDELQAAK